LPTFLIKFWQNIFLKLDVLDVFFSPQMIAKRGHYGAHMQEDWSLIRSMIDEARKNSKVRITAKIRKFENDDITLRYAQMLQNCGISILTVHGRTRAQRGPFTGLADWNIIKKIKQHLKIPVFANGNIQCLEHAKECIRGKITFPPKLDVIFAFVHF